MCERERVDHCRYFLYVQIIYQHLLLLSIVPLATITYFPHIYRTAPFPSYLSPHQLYTLSVESASGPINFSIQFSPTISFDLYPHIIPIFSHHSPRTTDCSTAGAISMPSRSPARLTRVSWLLSFADTSAVLFSLPGVRKKHGYSSLLLFACFITQAAHITCIHLYFVDTRSPKTCI